MILIKFIETYTKINNDFINNFINDFCSLFNLNIYSLFISEEDKYNFSIDDDIIEKWFEPLM